MVRNQVVSLELYSAVSVCTLLLRLLINLLKLNVSLLWTSIPPDIVMALKVDIQNRSLGTGLALPPYSSLKYSGHYLVSCQWRLQRRATLIRA